MKVLCIIPVFNEETNLKNTITSIKNHNHGVEKFLFVDSGSTDNSSKILANSGFEVVRLKKNKGIGYVLINGIKHAIKNNFDIITVIHGGNKMDTRDFKIILDPILNNQCDFVWGSRFQHNSAKNMPKFRKLSTPILSKLVSYYYKTEVTDATNGFRAYKVQDILKVLPNYDRRWLYGYGFEGFLFGKMLNSNLSSKEVPVTITYNKGVRHTKIKPIIDYPSIVVPYFLAKIIR